jgi:hypothetical protein
MTIKTQAFLQGYLHEKTAEDFTGSEMWGKAMPVSTYRSHSNKSPARGITGHYSGGVMKGYGGEPEAQQLAMTQGYSPGKVIRGGYTETAQTQEPMLQGYSPDSYTGEPETEPAPQREQDNTSSGVQGRLPRPAAGRADISAALRNKVDEITKRRMTSPRPDSRTMMGGHVIPGVGAVGALSPGLRGYKKERDWVPHGGMAPDGNSYMPIKNDADPSVNIGRGRYRPQSWTERGPGGLMQLKGGIVGPLAIDSRGRPSRKEENDWSSRSYTDVPRDSDRGKETASGERVYDEDYNRAYGPGAVEQKQIADRRLWNKAYGMVAGGK